MTNYAAEIATALPEIQAAALARMTDTVTITRPGETSTDATTGAVSTASAQVYSGPARWKAATTAPRADDVASAQVARSAGEVHIPVGSYIPTAGDVVECIASSDPLLVGRRARISSWWGGSQITAYRIPIEGE